MNRGVIYFITAVFLLSSCTTGTTATVRGGGGATLAQAQRQPWNGKKARLAVIRFVDKSAKGSGRIGDGLADMLTTELFRTNRFILLDRQDLDAVITEQDFASAGRVSPETAARTGEIEGAELLVFGAVTEFEPDHIGAGGLALGALTLGLSIAVAAHNRKDDLPIGAFTYKDSYVAIDLKIIDAKTGRVLHSNSVEGSYKKYGGGVVGGIGGGRSRVPALLGGFAGTGVEEAIRRAIDAAVEEIVQNTPSEYYRLDESMDMTPMGRLLHLRPVALPGAVAPILGEAQNRVIDTPHEYNQLLDLLQVDKATAPTFDWSATTLLAVFAGERPRKGFRIAMERGVDRGGRVEVTVVEVAGPPVPDAPEVAQLGPSYPYDIVQIERPDKKVVFLPAP